MSKKKKNKIPKKKKIDIDIRHLLDSEGYYVDNIGEEETLSI